MTARATKIMCFVIFALMQSNMAIGYVYIQLGEKHLKVKGTIINVKDPTELRVEAENKKYVIRYNIVDAGYKKWLKKKKFEDNNQNILSYRLKIRENLASLIAKFEYTSWTNIYFLVEQDQQKNDGLLEVAYVNFVQWAVYNSSGQLKKATTNMKKIAQCIEPLFIADQRDFRTISYTAQSLDETTKNEGDQNASRSNG